MMTKILVTGANGQVGKALKNILQDRAIYLTRSELDLSNPDGIYDAIAEYKPSSVINAAAYTKVDKAEEEENLAFRINAQSVGRMADYAFENNIPLVHYSTDYVFDGSGNKAWSEDDSPNPINAYGRTKLAGEKHIIAAAAKYKDTAKYLIFRTSWVYDATGHNFLNTMLKLGQAREVLSVISDQIGAPTFAGDIAKYSIEALQKAQKMEIFPSGIYNLRNGGQTSWHGFAEEIFSQASRKNIELAVREVMEIKTSDYKTAAKRPLNSRMSSAKIKDVFDITIRNWQEPIKEIIVMIVNRN